MTYKTCRLCDGTGEQATATTTTPPILCTRCLGYREVLDRCGYQVRRTTVATISDAALGIEVAK